jgi:hypothetical protein
MAVALHEIITERMLARPTILEATRVCGLTDSEVARLLGITPMQVNDWAKGRRRIPPVKHYALCLVMITLCGIMGKAPPASLYTKRATMLESFVRDLVTLALDDVAPKKLPEHITNAGMELAQEALQKLGGYLYIEE